MNTKTQQVKIDNAASSLPNSEKSDERLVAEVQVDAGSTAFSELVRRYSAPLHAYLSRILGDRTAAEDVLQDTLLKLFQHVNGFDTNRPLKPWLYTVARNQAVDYQRRNHRHRWRSLDSTPWLRDQLDNNYCKEEGLFDERRPPEQLLEAWELRDWVRRQVAMLPKPHRDVLEYTYFQGKTVREAAKLLGLPPNTVKSRNHASRARLVRAWQVRRLQRSDPPSKTPRTDERYTFPQAGRCAA